MSGCFTRTVDDNTAITLANQYGGSPTITVPLTALPNHDHPSNLDLKVGTWSFSTNRDGWHIHEMTYRKFNKSGDRNGRKYIASDKETNDQNDLITDQTVHTDALKGIVGGVNINGQPFATPTLPRFKADAGFHSHSITINFKQVFEDAELKVMASGEGQPFDHQPQYVMVYKIMKYKVDA